MTVGDFTFGPGYSTVPFEIEAVGAEGTGAKIVLSAWEGYSYDSTNWRETDYLEVPVYVSEELPPSVVIDCDTATITAGGDYTQAAAVLQVYLTQAYDADEVKVTVTPTFTDGSAADWKNYFRFSTTLNTIDEPSADNSDAALPTVTIPKGSTEKQTIYVFALRGDTHTIGTAKVKFETSIADPTADAVITQKGTRSVNVVPETTKIIAPAAGSKAVSTTCNDEYPFTIAVSDTYADTHDSAIGYSIYIKYRSSDTFTKLDGTYYVGDGGALYKLDLTDPLAPKKTTDQPILKYTASGENLESQVYVVAPVNPNTGNAKKSEIITFYADVKEARTVAISPWDEDFVAEKRTFNEGDSVGFKIRLSEKNETGSTIYAYLKPSDNVEASQFASDAYNCVIGMDDPSGLPINNSQQECEGMLQLLDGKAKPGLKPTFSVVLSSDANWDGTDQTKIIKGYDSNYTTITIYNVEPTIKRIEMNNLKHNAEFHFANKLPSGQEQTFKLYVNDPGSYDVTNTTKPFEVRWSAMLSDGTVYHEPSIIKGNPSSNTFKYKFPAAGIWSVTAEVKDKDMSDWSEVTYTVYVTVLDQPSVEHNAAELVLDEKVSANDASLRKLDVGVSYWDPKFSGVDAALDVIVQVSLANPEKTQNPGILKLDSAFALSKTAAEQILTDLANPEHTYDSNSDYYLVKLTKTSMRQSIAFTELDGTDNSSIYGFKIQSFVISKDTLPTSDGPADKYYLTSQPTIVLVNNLTPEFGANTTLENTNAWAVAGGMATDRPIKYQVKFDVDADWDTKWADGTGPGIKITFSGCQNAKEFFITEPTSGTFIPDFTGYSDEQMVTMTIEDKDGGFKTWTYLYEIAAAKNLITISTGPGGGTTTSRLSQKYANSVSGGTGAGHTYVSGATFSKAENFQLSWNCGKNVYMSIYGFGYKSGDVDNGNLNNNLDQAIDLNGNNDGSPITSYYTYTDPDEKDSYHYCWILTTMDENGTPADAILGETISPERPGKVASGRVPLPTEETEEGGYVDTIVEAVFAKEWMPADNLGDINQDGIPDVFATTVWPGANTTLIQAGTGGEILDNDLANLAKVNTDEDYLPGVWNNKGEVTLVDNAKGSYAPIGHAFTAIREIRGFHDGLNAIGNGFASDVNFSEEEHAAWEAYAAAKGLDPVADLKLENWSPEPSGKQARLDPTTDDTDADGMPDGWEYYFWYMAKVWLPAGSDAAKPADGQQFVFERFNPANILRGTEIPADEVLARFNPCDPLDTTAKDFNADFDNDGLSDMEELLIGTNPCHWDTDGDHMCDGWEVMMAVDPLGGSKVTNPDGDFMAFCNLNNVWSLDLGGQIVFDLHGELVEVDPITGEGDYEMVESANPYYADKSSWDKQKTIVAVEDAKNADGEDNYPLYVNADGIYTIDDVDPVTGAANTPAMVKVPQLVRDVTLTKAFIASPKFNDDGKPYTYGLPMAEEFPPNNPEFWHWGYPMLEGLAANQTITLTAGTQLAHNGYILIHDQVHTAFGFDPRTGWYCNKDGYVADRWNPQVNKELSPFDSTGVAVNTEPYATYDEYLLMRYRSDFGVYYPDGAKVDKDAWKNFTGLTTRPSVIYSATDLDTLLNSTNSSFSTSTSGTNDLVVTANIAEKLADAFAEAGSSKNVAYGHGADTDSDGVPDGWELYVHRCPNAGPSIDSMEGFSAPWDKEEMDFTPDLLGYAEEYAGTDSCNAYRNCPSIYNNHPGISAGWFNKFFPTDPDNPDTDGDGIYDGVEGMAWMGTFYTAGNSYILGAEDPGMTFIYGNPVDSITTCVRGGGMNPLTVDTDNDGLPDLWEMQFAGVPVDANTRKYVPPKDGSYVDILFSEATFTADGLNAPDVSVASNVVYIAGGLDATWGGDAWTDTVEQGASYDEHLGTIRDVDFDHDGLQNYQEYLIQQVRHFRYDDSVTPLNGFVLGKGFLGYVPMNQDAKAFAELCQEAGYPADVTSTFTANQWKRLGYFASPAHSWDRMVTCMTITPAIMYAPQGTAPLVMGTTGCYISSDPRLSDTDLDGMDDYYEMFHGLNPLLGTTVPEPMSTPQADQIWLALGMPADPFPCSAFRNQWTGMQMLTTAEAADPIKYPWVAGTNEADPDGDGLRNDSERITANLASPETMHTDPTPLWFTDSSSASSFVSQYYALTGPVPAMPWWPLVPLFDDPYSQAAPLGGVGYPLFITSFEENEGYDTDNDWVGDGREIVKTMNAVTDPLDFSDPVRRQAFYLNGSDSFAMTRNSHLRGIDAVDFFKQFTVEAWVRPERTGEQTIIERSCAYGYSALNKDDAAIRANFRIGLNAAGKIYGMFDNSDAIESGANEVVSCQTVTGPVLPLDKWSHVALTYTGSRLTLYVNGVSKAVADTKLIPANGVTMIAQDPTYTNTFTATSYACVPSALFIGARPVAAAAGGVNALETVTVDYGQLREWYQGYVDEVRIWDGARTEAEIAGSYRTRMTLDEAATNRLEIYTKLMSADADSSRNDNDGLNNLPAELVQHYDFSTLPGAAAADYVAKTPVGLEKAVFGQTASAAGTAFTGNIGWWDACATRSTVYTDYRVLPWIENTVHHLPVMDGSVVDSFLYSEKLGGYYTPALQHELGKYTFPNSAMPYQYYIYALDRYQRLFCLNQLAKANPDNEEIEDILMRYRFEIRSDFVGTSDLIPMGGAFAKQCVEMWDGQGAADTWEYTRVDTDADGLPDWWEEKYGLDKNSSYDWNKMIGYNGKPTPAWEAYLRDLAAGMQPDGKPKPEFEATADGDGDGLLDWWQRLYAVTQGGAGDDDNDGLSNYVEYLLSEVFDLDLKFSPVNPYSVQDFVSDYFYRLNQLYVGEIFTDHDNVKDQWEAGHLQTSDQISPYAFDGILDPDGDGWDNYSEFQAGTDPTRLGSLGVDAIQLDEFPVPTIELTVAYRGSQNIANMPIVVKAWSDQSLASIPDAIWNIGGEGEVTQFEGGGSNIVTGVKHFGMNPRKEMLMHLSPGSVVAGSVKFEFKDLAWVLFNPMLQQAMVSDPATAIWQGAIIDRQRNDDADKGDIVDQISGEIFGSIDYVTGAVNIDFAKLPETLTIVGDISGAYQDEGWYSLYDLTKSYVRVNWQSKPITGGNVSTYYLAEADDPSADNNSLGHVKQGLNTFIAFYDFDGSGMYTPGEPYGFVRDVDVGWNYGKLTVELTDTNPVFARYNLVGGGSAGGSTTEAAATDREVLFPGNEDVINNAEGVEAPIGNIRVRVVRHAVDSLAFGNLTGTARAVVYDRTFSTAEKSHPNLTEADILNMVGNEFDIDWNAKAIEGNGSTLEEVFNAFNGRQLEDGSFVVMTNVYYALQIGNGPIEVNTLTNATFMPKIIVRKFDLNRTVPTAIAPGVGGYGVVNTPAPVFTWTDNGFNTYTAFRIRITGGGLDWTSDYQLMPAKDAQGNYSWTAPLRAGAIVPGGKVEFKNGETYSWKISTYNAKFKSDSWVDGGSFKMNVLTNSQDYGTIRTAVRYFGPDAVRNGGTIRVQAFTTPDFSGTPVAEGYVKAADTLIDTGSIESANAEIIGVKAGSYYLRAFIDLTGEGVRDNWESWGAYCTRDVSSGTIFAPKSVKVGPGCGEGEIITISIEDCDVDQDFLPDAWEWTQKKNLTSFGASSLDQSLTGGFVMKQSLVGAITSNGKASSGLAVMMTAKLSTPRVAALMLGVDASGSDNDVMDALADAGSSVEIEENSVAITSIALDAAARQVKLGVSAEVESAVGDALASSIYTFTGSDTITVTCRVMRKATLMDADWVEVAAKDVVISPTIGIGTLTVDLGDEVDLSSGFFKVVLEEK